MAERSLIAFVGVLAPMDDRSDNAAFSQAGLMFQESLMTGLEAAGSRIDSVFAQRPMPSFPREPRLFVPRQRAACGVRHVVYLPFINFGAIKTLTSGVALFVALVGWGWRKRRTRNKVILLYNLTSPPGIASVIAGHLIRAKVVAVVADIQVPGSGSVSQSLLRRVEYRLQTATMGACDGLVVLTKSMSTDFARNVPAIVMEGAVPAQLLSSYTPVDQDIGLSGPNVTDGPILMFAGELSELKGVPALLDAFTQLHDPSIRLWISGRGPEQRRVEFAASADHRIHYWGYPAYPELLRLYRAATLLVNPHSTTHLSAKYLFPSKLIEYLATGTPVLTTPSTPEIASQYGKYIFLTESDSADAIARAIKSVLAVPRTELAIRGHAGREFVLRDKTWEIQGGRIAAFINDVAAERARG